MNNIRKNLGISISVGLLTGLWVFIAEKLDIPAWPGFIGWSLFFFTGANFDACKKTLPCIILGSLLAYITVYVQTAFNTSGITAALIAMVLGFTMTISQSFYAFAAVSVTFVSCNIYFASGSLIYSILVTSVGLILGMASIKFGEILNSTLLKK